MESIKSDKTYVLEKPSADLQVNVHVALLIGTLDRLNSAVPKRVLSFQEIPRVEDTSQKSKDLKLAELKQRKKHLRRECDKLEREKEMLMEQLIKMKSESRTAYNFAPCTHAIQQHNVRIQLSAVAPSPVLFRVINDDLTTQAEVSKNGILLRLRHQEMKNRHLRNLLLQQQKKLNKTMRGLEILVFLQS